MRARHSERCVRARVVPSMSTSSSGRLNSCWYCRLRARCFFAAAALLILASAVGGGANGWMEGHATRVGGREECACATGTGTLVSSVR